MSKRFDRLLDKATDATLIDPNWDAIIECVDSIRSGDAPLKPALLSIKKRCRNDNPHIAHHALLVLEACMKNCGAKFHVEVATKDFMEDFKNLLLESNSDKVKNKVLELLQCWTVAFKNKPEYKIVVDTHNLMKLAGFDFPSLKEADAMFIAESAPEWADGEECFRCRTAFGLITRKHHCRACGQIFCDKCSSKQSYLPQYGIEKQVRVCDGCYDKTPSGKKITVSSDSLKSVLLSQATAGKNSLQSTSIAKISEEERAREIQQAEEDELNLAIALSQSEAEAKEQERQRTLYQMYNGMVPGEVNEEVNASLKNILEVDEVSSSSIYKGAALSKVVDEPVENGTDQLIQPELARYLNKEYWQQRKQESKSIEKELNGADVRQTLTPTAPPPSESSSNHCTVVKRDPSICSMSVTSTVKHFEEMNILPQHFKGTTEEEVTGTLQFCNQLKEQVTIMDNRIRSNIARNRPIINDSAIQSLFLRLTELHAQVIARINKLEDQRSYFESLQDQLAHIQEARQALNALRDEYQRQKQERALEEQRLRQRQMQEKVDFMRQKKHEMLLQQRHLALLRFQQQEEEIRMRRMQQSQQPQHLQQLQQAQNLPQTQQPQQTVDSTNLPMVHALPQGHLPSSDMSHMNQQQLVYSMHPQLMSRIPPSLPVMYAPTDAPTNLSGQIPSQTVQAYYSDPNFCSSASYVTQYPTATCTQPDLTNVNVQSQPSIENANTEQFVNQSAMFPAQFSRQPYAPGAQQLNFNQTACDYQMEVPYQQFIPQAPIVGYAPQPYPTYPQNEIARNAQQPYQTTSQSTVVSAVTGAGAPQSQAGQSNEVLLISFD